MMWILSTVVVSLLLVSPAEAASQAPDQRPAFPTAVEMVKVDVLVRDRVGKPVRGLLRRDFSLFEDGVPQEVQSFDAVEPPPQPVATPPPETLESRVSTNVRPEDPTAPAHFMILFDDIRITPPRTGRAIATIKRFLESMALPGDRVMIATSEGSVAWSGRVGDAREELVAQVESLKGRRVKDEGEQIVTELEAFLIVERDDQEALARALERARRFGSKPGLLVDPTAARIVRPAAIEVLAAARLRTRTTLRTMEWMLRLLSPARGRRTLILVSEGFHHDTGVSEFRNVLSAALQAAITVYNLDLAGLATPDLRFEQSGAPDLVQSDLRFATESTGGSESIATATGGFTIKNTNNLAGGLQKVAEEAHTYYLLGYRPKSTARDGRFRHIEVRLKGLKEKGYSVQARRGYYPVPEEAPPPSEIDAASRLELGAEIPLRLTAFVERSAGEGMSRVRLLAEADPSAIRFLENQGVLVASIESSTRVTLRGHKTGESATERTQIRTPPDRLPDLRSRWLALTRELDLAPGKYQARFQVKDLASGRQGTVRHSFDVPRLDSFRLTTPILTDQLGPDGAPRHVARRSFATGSRLLCDFEVLGAQKEGSSARVVAGFVLAGPAGKVVARSQPAAIASTPDGRLPRRFAVSLKDLPPGEYAIEVTVHDDLAGQELVHREPFAIEAPPVPSLGTPNALLALFDDYRRGNPKAAVSTLLSWPHDQLAAGLRAIENRSVECPSACLRAALLIQLEASVRERTLQNDRQADALLGHSRKLVPRLLDQPGNEHFLRDWLLAAGYALRQEGMILVPQDLFGECARRFDKDAACQLALGSVYEAVTFASLPLEADLGVLPSTAGFPNDPKARFRAHNAYQRALQLAPDSAEAHLRFGRFLQRRGENQRAERELQWVLDHSQVLHYRVLAHLFLGRLAEERRHFDAAQAHYRAAIEEQPSCQAARLALSNALLLGGRQREAIAAAREALGAPDDPDALESWLAYRLDDNHAFERRMQALSEQVRP